MDYYPLPENAVRQFIDASTVFGEYRHGRAAARQYRGGMYWKKQGDYCYLVKTTTDNRQKRIGVYSPETEAIYQEFVTRKLASEARLASLRYALRDAERLNKALKVGRVPTIVIGVLQAIEDADLAEHFTVVGTHALYAFESAAGVRIIQSALATQDVDLPWDARRKVKFMTDISRLDSSVLGLLQIKVSGNKSFGTPKIFPLCLLPYRITKGSWHPRSSAIEKSGLIDSSRACR